MKSLPVVGITMGDPSGVGPEIIVKALRDPSVFKTCRPVVFGDPGALSMGMPDLKAETMHMISGPSDARGRPGEIDLVPVSRLDKHLMLPGRPTT